MSKPYLKMLQNMQFRTFAFSEGNLYHRRYQRVILSLNSRLQGGKNPGCRFSNAFYRVTEVCIKNDRVTKRFLSFS